MQKPVDNRGNLILLNNTILTRNTLAILCRTSLVLFSIFTIHFAIQAYLNLLDHLGALVVNMLLFIVSILSIHKIYTIKLTTLYRSLSIDNLRVVRFRTPFIKSFIRPVVFSYPYAEFEDENGTVKKYRVCLEKPVLSQFKIELVKKDIRVEEYYQQKSIL